MVVAACIAVGVAAAYFLVSRGPSFTISVSPSTLSIPRGGSDNIIITFDPPKIPGNLGTGFVDLPEGVECPNRGAQPPASFWFTLSSSENAVPGSYTVTITAEDMDRGLSASASFSLTVTSLFNISVSPDTLIISRGGTKNVTITYDPAAPSNLGMSTSISGPGPGIQIGEWIDPPFTFPVMVSEDATLGAYTVTLEATDQDTGAKATTTFTVTVT